MMPSRALKRGERMRFRFTDEISEAALAAGVIVALLLWAGLTLLLELAVLREA